MRHLMTWLALALAAAVPAACGDGGGFRLGPEARVEVSPTSVVFGDVPRGGEAQRNVTIRHTGVSGVIKLDPVELVADSPDLSVVLVEKTRLLPGEEARVVILYRSDGDAPDTGELTIGLNVASTPRVVVPVSTPGQRGQLVASPATVDFGVVQAGAPRTVDVTLTNIGTAPAPLTGYTVDGDADGDFSASLGEGVVVDPQASRVVQLTYAPKNQDSDKGFVTILTDRADVKVTIPVEGEEETPILVIEPSIVQLGWVEPGGSRPATLKMRNDGNTDLTVNSLELADATSNLVLSFPPGFPKELPFTLVPGKVVEFGAIWSPVEQLAMSAEPMARLVVGSSDEAHNPLEVPFFGAAGQPSILVTPEDVVDFAYVAEGFNGKRTVTVLNVGDDKVTVTGARLEDATTDEFAFPDADELPRTLNPGEATTVTLTFENRAGDSGTEFARFLLETTDPLVPVYPLDVVARRAERPTCEPAFVPELLAMGAFAAGSTAEDVISVVNFGSGTCEYRDWELIGCQKVQLGVRHRFDCDPSFPDSPFTVVDSPVYGTALGPGDKLDFRVRFEAPPIFNTALGRDLYYARLALIMHDPGTNGFKFVAPPGGWMAGVNLRAESALPILGVDPPEIQFGTVRAGCESTARVVTISNLGPMEGTVKTVALEGCDANVVVKNLPPTPFKVAGYEQRYLEIAYAPGVLSGDLGCQLVLETDALNLPVARVDLLGKSVDIDHQVDTFDQLPTPKVDVLFVVDDSGSMADEQQLLKKELPKLVQIAASWGQDYHMAVTTTDTKLLRGKFKGTPAYVTPAQDPALFAQHLVVGTAGYFEEAGLEGGWLALSGTNVASTDIACVDAPNACPTGFRCMEGKCRGANWGFMRPDADLVLIIISDEEDSSPQTVDWYVGHFAALKAPQSGYGVKVHAIVTTLEGCFGAAWGSAGLRYIQAVNAFDGHVSSICATDFPAEFEAIGNKSFGLKDQFHPTLPVDPATLEIRIDGQPCSTGWSWNPNTLAVVFDEGSACFPPFDSTVEVEYDVICQSP